MFKSNAVHCVSGTYRNSSQLVAMLSGIDIPNCILSVLELQRMNEVHLVSI
jgi:hypothetical protein